MFRHNQSFLVLKVYYLFVAAFLNYKSSETPNNMMMSLMIQQRGALYLYRIIHTSSCFWKKCIFCVLEIYFFHQINIYTFSILKMRNSKNKWKIWMCFCWICFHLELIIFLRIQDVRIFCFDPFPPPLDVYVE